MRNTNGFTLIEIAIIICIIGILFSGGLKLIGTHIDMRRTAENNARLAEARDAVIGYAIAQQCLPCPADDTDGNVGSRRPIGSGNSNFKNACVSRGGFLPWNTLGVRKTDVWGQPFTYYIAPHFSRKSVPSTIPGYPPTVKPGITTNTNSSQADIRIWQKEASGAQAAGDAVAVIISNGPDKNLNAQININNFYNSDAEIPGFDDQVVWITVSTLLRDYVKSGQYEGSN